MDVAVPLRLSVCQRAYRNAHKRDSKHETIYDSCILYYTTWVCRTLSYLHNFYYGITLPRVLIIPSQEMPTLCFLLSTMTIRAKFSILLYSVRPIKSCPRP